MPRKKKVAQVLEDVLLREPSIKLTVKTMGKLYHSVGNTFDEAIDALGVKNAKGLSIWRLEQNGKVIEKIIRPTQTFKIFGFHGMARDIVRKSFRTIFGQ